MKASHADDLSVNRFRSETIEPTWPTVAATIGLVAGGASLASLPLFRDLRFGVPVALAASALAGSWLSPHWPGVARRLPPGAHVALTFDDGPHPDTTPFVLDKLSEKGAHATFLVLGQSAALAPGLLRRMTDEGHTVGIHGWDHRPLTLRSAARLRNDLRRTRDVVEDATGEPVRWFRPPYGYRGPMLAHILREMALTLVGWRFAAHDWSATTGDEVHLRIESRVRGRDIVLLHDAGPGAGHTLSALPRILATLRGRALRAVSLDEGFAPVGTSKGDTL